MRIPLALLAFFVALFLVVLLHRPRGNLLGAIAITTAFLSRFLNMLVHALFLLANTAHGFFFLLCWHSRNSLYSKLLASRLDTGLEQEYTCSMKLLNTEGESLGTPPGSTDYESSTSPSLVPEQN